MRKLMCFMLVVLGPWWVFGLHAGSVEERLKRDLEHNLQGLEITHVQALPDSNWYQINEGPHLFYVDKDGRYAFKGDVISLKTPMKNLSEAERAAFRVRIIEQLTSEEVLAFKAPQERHKLYVFTDLTCPHCRNFHQEVAALNQGGVSVVYIAFPRRGNDSPAMKLMQQVWCANRPQEAYQQVVQGQDVPEGSSSCNKNLSQQFEAGLQVGVRVTPTLVTPKGLLIEGGQTAATLLSLLLAESDQQ